MINKVLAFLCLGILALSMSYTSMAFNSEEVDDEMIISYLKETVVEFYENKDIGEHHDFGKMMDDELAVYLEDKANTHIYASNLYESKIENYKVEVKLIKAESNNKELIATFQVITTYNYIGLSEVTTVSEETILVYSKEKALIIDFYCPLNYYDVAMRGEKDDTRKSLDSIPRSVIKKNQEQLKRDIDRVFLEESAISPTEEKPGISRYSNLSTSSIVTYARNNYYNSQPSSGNGVVPYYDFSEISGNYDCTNFVSHALLAGGANVYDTGGAGICSTGWYYRNLSNRSTSWSVVTHLYSYLVNNTHSNAPTGVSSMYSTNPYMWTTGYVMQFKFSGEPDYRHSTIITIKEYSADGERAYAYITGRTSDTQYNDNQAVSSYAPGSTKRTIYVYNY